MSVDEFFKSVSEFTDTVYDIDVTNKFKKQLTLAFNRGLNLELLKEVIYVLAKGEKLADKYKLHKLVGFSETVWECHVKPDWLLTWKYSNYELVLILLETGSHSDLF
jgi:mRNA interferase YafQ